MPQYGSYPQVSSITANDTILFHQNSSGQEKLIDFTDLLASLSLPIPVTADVGGTGITSYNQGDIIYASATTTLSKLPKSATQTNYLSNAGANNNPSWAKIDLATGVSGNLPVANLGGGTGAGATSFWRGDGTWSIIPGTVSADIQVFSTPGVFAWTKPIGAKVVHVSAIGGGSGGGSGRRGAAGTVRYGGGGAAGNYCATVTLSASLLGATEVVWVGAGGIGGAAVLTDDTDGADGSYGGTSRFGKFVQAQAGQPGQGGTNISSYQGFAFDGLGFIGGGSGGGNSSPSLKDGRNAPGIGGGGGGQGGWIDGANALHNPGTGGASGYFLRYNPIYGGDIFGSGQNGLNSDVGEAQCGSGGGGGISFGPSQAERVGGMGGFYGGAGGGGAASANGTPSGGGGDGWSGIVIVTTYF